MSVVQSFVMTSCALSIIFSVISLVVDTSKFEREFKFLLVGIFSIILVRSMLQLDLSFFKGISLSENPYNTQDSVDNCAVQTSKITLENSIRELLTSNGMICENISIDINITEDNCISINRVYLLVNDFSYAKRLIIENFGDLNIENLGGD